MSYKQRKKSPESDESELDKPELDEPELGQLVLKKEMERPDCLKGAPGNLRWKQGGCYFENASGAASIALVATRMLRTMLYHSEVLAAPDVEEIASFLKFVGYEEDIRKYVRGLHIVGQDTDSDSSTLFGGLFRQDGNPAL